MQAGKLNRRITNYSQTTSQDAAGGELPKWAPIYSCWAGIDIQSSQLIYATAEFVEKVTHRITLRWTPSVVIAPDMRIVHVERRTSNTHYYNIESLLNTKQGNRELIALAYEINGLE